MASGGRARHADRAASRGCELDMTGETLRGSCLCGEVTYEVRAPFLRFAHCHCARCCKATGSAHATNLYVPPGQFSWTSRTDSVVRFDLPSAKSFATTFCGRCGSPPAPPTPPPRGGGGACGGRGRRRRAP